MNLLWVVLLPLIGTLVPLLTERFGRNVCAFSVALLPAWSLVLVLMHVGEIFDGEAIRQTIEWIPSMGLDLSCYQPARAERRLWCSKTSK